MADRTSRLVSLPDWDLLGDALVWNLKILTNCYVQRFCNFLRECWNTVHSLVNCKQQIRLFSRWMGPRINVHLHANRKDLRLLDRHYWWRRLKTSKTCLKLQQIKRYKFMRLGIIWPSFFHAIQVSLWIYYWIIDVRLKNRFESLFGSLLFWRSPTEIHFVGLSDYYTDSNPFSRWIESNLGYTLFVVNVKTRITITQIKVTTKMAIILKFRHQSFVWFGGRQRDFALRFTGMSIEVWISWLECGA